MLFRRYLRHELGIVLDAISDVGSRLVMGPDTTDVALDGEGIRIDAESGELVAAGVLRGHLREAGQTSSRSIILMGGLNRVDDIYAALEGVADEMRPDQRVVSVTYNRLWRPFVRSARSLGIANHATENWVQVEEICNLFEQSGFEVVQRRQAVFLPIPIPFISRWLNRWVSQLPILRAVSLFNVVVARPLSSRISNDPKVSVVVAARNEEGNIAELVRRLPQMSTEQELIFVEGGSSDGTWQAILEAQASCGRSGLSIKALQQQGRGKGDAVRLGFENATGEIFIILDADLSVPPEELPRFINVLRTGACEFANGSRLVYPMEKQAMRFLNLLGNRFFGLAFTFLLGQPVRDTLCGTKALWAADYRRIAADRSHFGDFDPFGDFDLLFGAARLQLRLRDVPVHYKERTYGSTNISRFRHGLLLARMTIFAARKICFV